MQATEPTLSSLRAKRHHPPCRRFRLSQCRRMSDKRRSHCNASKVSRLQKARKTCPRGFFLRRGTSDNCPRQECHNQGKSERPYYTSNPLGDSGLVSLHSQYEARNPWTISDPNFAAEVRAVRAWGS